VSNGLLTSTEWYRRRVSQPEDDTRTCVVLGPLLFLTVTIELEADKPRVHLHPGGQGFWIARMVNVLGERARLVAPIGGEAGDVLAALMPGWEIDLEAVRGSLTSPTQVHDRRAGERVEIVGVEMPELDRHESDDLYAAVLQAGLSADAVVLTSAADSILPHEAYSRLVHDLAAQDIPLFADMHGDALDSVFEGGSLQVLKVSEEDLRHDGWQIGSEHQAMAAARELVERGAGAVVISRGAEPAIAVVDGNVLRIEPPPLTEVDHAGAGDSMTAGITVGRMRGLSTVDAIKLGAAAGAGNVIRRGLGSGSRDLIGELTELVQLEEVS
jgi:1-phosphofructokinase